jgi:hypothetical protein
MKLLFSLLFTFLFLGAQASLPASAHRKSVHSFDCFDTLVGRLHKDPHSTFRIVEKKFPFPGFAALRIKAATLSNETLDDIYRKMGQLKKISPKKLHQLRAFEFKTELENIFPIKQNLSRVRTGDIIVSDTYYSSKEVRSILLHAGLKKSVHVFAKPFGKVSESIWPHIQRKYTLLSHRGDNNFSDVTSPQKHGIPTKHFNKTEYTCLEKKVAESRQGELANLMRALRLLNPYKKGSVQYTIWNEQAEYNVPILILSSYYLADFCEKNQKKTILFSQRGCFHWIKIFKALFPKYHSIDFMTSRIMFRNPSPEYIKYVQSLYTSRTVIVDEQGAGESCFLLFQAAFSQMPTQLAIFRLGHSFPGIVYDRRTPFESLNYAPYGSLIQFTKKGPVRAPLEYNAAHIAPAIACIKKCIHLLPYYQEFFSFDEKALAEVVTSLETYTPALLHCHVGVHVAPKT